MNAPEKKIGKPMNRVDGRQKVTGAAKYSAEYELPNMAYAVLVGSTIAKGRLTGLDTKAAERAPGVLAVITHLNAPKAPGIKPAGKDPSQPQTVGSALQVLVDDNIRFNDQPIAVVVADTLERARFAARLVQARYAAEKHLTNLEAAKPNAFLPTQAKKNPKSPTADYQRGQVDAYKTGALKLEAEYVIPTEVHHPMELQSITAHWEAPDRLTLYDKTQGTMATRRDFARQWGLPEANVKVIATFVGGAFGNALHSWPHESAAIIAAKVVNRPVKLMLTREQMFTMVGYRPHTWQKIGMSATADGKITAITHESIGQTSTYEEFTESTLGQTKMMYQSPNLTTRYRLAALDIGSPIWMRGPGEATGAFALESAMDEMAHLLNLDPLEFRMRNYTEQDPEKDRPWSSKFLKECYQAGAQRIGWNKRQLKPGALRDGEWLVGYGMGVGTFGAHRGSSKASAQLLPNGTVLLQSAVTDIGPGTGTAMTQIAADTLGLAPEKIRFEWGNSDFAQAPTQGGSAIVNTVGPAVQEACLALKDKLRELAAASNGAFATAKKEDITFTDNHLTLAGNPAARAAYADLVKQAGGTAVTVESKPSGEGQKYSMYSFSVHFAEVRVHELTGEVRVSKLVSCADAGTIVNEKTAGNQMKGGAVGGIGMALMEHAIIDDRFGRYVTKDLADYHVPVHADAPAVEVYFVNQPDPHVNALGTKGIGEIATIGVAPAIANAVFNATGKRVRELPITPDKLV
ncbi:xanthine dehydrogenase family protein molybdopterin-binding subunit [Hymenobacter properus]|uniref:Xanthine dehydrogenase family protein molybdopterin-binding subunit n=1 Tax=Hymenobacter properus TaxID=2791026 RepID=A0A931BGF8_9BACT|nr:xanthine dehydrogenase family protein molybdopterin-binding subunit [Hymenobacter properus]MBF9141842.1 xanthine dehydrogenase family protein molybdopterin-binding subunit [Hymenobacter properus]MBR7720650.1 xanthine dehydrogenase family protein molybdopterin-binding subunit [Microvirga sp. SRT04]